MPAQNVAIEPPVGIAALPDRLVIRAFLSAPFVAHGSLHAACRRLKSILRSDAFRDQRLESGWAERGVVLAGGRRAFGAVAECCMLCKSRWRPVAPMRGPRSDACSVVIDNEMWVMGGVDDGDRTLATVEVYSPKTNTWRLSTPMSQRRHEAVAGVVDGRMVVAGGFRVDDGRFDRQARVSSAEAYTGTAWTPVSLGKAMRAGMRAGMARGRDLIPGTNRTHADFVWEIMDISTGRPWTNRDRGAWTGWARDRQARAFISESAGVDASTGLVLLG